MKANKVLICILLAVFFQGFPVIYTMMEARSSVLFTEKISDISGEVLQKDLFPKKSGNYTLEVFYEEKDPDKQISNDTFEWTFGSQGKELAKGKGPTDLTMNGGQIYSVALVPSTLKRDFTAAQQEKLIVRLALNRIELLNDASQRYIQGTVLSIIFAALAYWFWRQGRKRSGNPQMSSPG